MSYVSKVTKITTTPIPHPRLLSDWACQVWDDMPNPMEELAWYKNFAPSDEEVRKVAAV